MDFAFEQISLTKKRDLHIMVKSLVGDSVGIQTQDLRNRNPALYSAKLRSHKVFAKILQNFENSKIIEWKIPIRFFMMQVRRVNQQVQNYKTYLKNSHFGVEKFNFSLGLSFNFFCIDIILFSV